MQLINLQHMMTNELQRRKMMYARLEDTIRAGSFSLEDYEQFCDEACNLWPSNAVTNEWDFLMQYMPRRHPFSDTYFAVYEVQCMPQQQININDLTYYATAWRTTHVTNMNGFRGITVNARGRECGVLPMVLFFNSEDEVRNYYFQVLHIQCLAYHIIELFFQQFEEFSQHNINQFAKTPLERYESSFPDYNRYNTVYYGRERNLLTETEDEINVLNGGETVKRVNMNPILTLCFKQLGNTIKEVSAWKSKGIRSSYLLV